MNNTFLKYTLTFFLGVAIGIGITQRSCDREVIVDKTKEAELYTRLNESIKDKELFKKKADSLNKQVVNLKARKSKIIYKTKFDTLATIDTVIVELVRCDSVVKLSDTIIVKQGEQIETLTDALNESENIQVIQADIIKEKDAELAAHKKQLKKEKRKVFFARALSVVVIAGVIILVAL